METILFWRVVMKKLSNRNTLHVLAKHLSKDIQSGKVQLYHLSPVDVATPLSFKKAARDYSESILKIAQTPWYMSEDKGDSSGFSSTPEENPYLDDTTSTNDSEEDLGGENSTQGNQGLQSDIFGSTYANPQGNDVQAAIQTSIMGLKDTVFNLAKSLYGFDLSEEDSMKIVKESLKNMSSKIADIPIDAYVQKIDSYLDGSSKTTTKTPGSPNDAASAATPDQTVAPEAPGQELMPPPVEDAAAPQEAPVDQTPKQSMLLANVKGVTKTAIDWGSIITTLVMGGIFVHLLPSVIPALNGIKSMYDSARKKYREFETGYEGEYGDIRNYTMRVMDVITADPNFAPAFDKMLNYLDEEVRSENIEDDTSEYLGNGNASICLDAAVVVISQVFNEQLENDLDPDAVREYLLDMFGDRFST